MLVSEGDLTEQKKIRFVPLRAVNQLIVQLEIGN